MELLEKYFDVAFAAPDGVQKLRELILSLAMRGKLVTQNPQDTPARDLLKEIAAEKQRLIKEKKIKKSKKLPDVMPEEVPYELPDSWEWCYLNNVCTLITDGTHYTPTYTEIGVPFLSVKDISSGKLDFSNTRFISSEEHQELTKRCHPERGDVLLTKVGTTGIAVAIDKKIDFSIFVSVALLKLVQGTIDPNFLTSLINSPLVKKYSLEGTEGVGNKNLVLRKIKAFLIPLPPLEEQKRIVEKIDSLMARCDELEKLRKERDEKQLIIHAAASDKLLKAPDSQSFDDAWRFISRHFSPIYSVKENVSELRKVILQLAVMGKLVPQNPNDPPAQELLQEIAAEKQRLIKEKKIKKSKPLPDIKPEEIPYEIPDSWEWIRLGTLFSVTSGKNLPKNKMNQGHYPVYGGNGIAGYHDQFNTEKPTIVIGRVGYYCGSIHLTPAKAWITDNAFFTIYDEKRLYQQFVIWLLKTINLQVNTSSTAQPVISGSKIYPILIPLPPLEEQKRIVAKVNKLMKLCDQLEQNIDNSTHQQTQLLNAIMAKI